MAADQATKNRPPLKRGSDNALAKLTEAIVVDILHRLHNGENGKQIADSLGVSVSAVSLIKRGKTWQHVPRPQFPPKTTKHCRRCDTSKPFADFYARQDGKPTTYCKVCTNRLSLESRRTPEGRQRSNARNRGYRQAEEFKANRRERDRQRYATDPVYRARVLAACAEFATTERGQQMRQAAMVRYAERHPERIKARQVVNNAIARGALAAPSEHGCHVCGLRASEYHHHNGYSQECWLDVVPVCKGCHELID